MTDVRAITVKQPWAWAIAHGGKNIENRSRPVSYRGPLLIHAGAAWSHRGAADPRIAAAWGPWHSGGVLPACHPCPDRDLFPSAVLAVAELVDVHVQTLDCLTDPDRCDPWGEQSYLQHNPDRTTRMVFDVQHFVLEDVRALPDPVPATGRLGLWRPSPEVLDAVHVQLEDTPAHPVCPITGLACAGLDPAEPGWCPDRARFVEAGLVTHAPGTDP